MQVAKIVTMIQSVYMYFEQNTINGTKMKNMKKDSKKIEQDGTRLKKIRKRCCSHLLGGEEEEEELGEWPGM
jgi:hypothetical protein